MAERPYMDRLDDFDESTVEGRNACIDLMPLAVAALRFIYDGHLNADAALREAVECIEMLPIAALTVKEPRKGGGGNG